jgi:hypothetical protein
MRTEPTAGARIHRSYQLKARGKVDRRARPSNLHSPHLNRGTQSLNGTSSILRKLVEKQYATMRKAYLSWSRATSAPNQACITDNMVWSTVRALTA